MFSVLSVTLRGLIRKQRNEHPLMWNASPAFCKWKNWNSRALFPGQVTIDKHLISSLSATNNFNTEYQIGERLKSTVLKPA